MANATKDTGLGVVRWDDEFGEESSATLASQTTFWPNALIGRTTAGYLAKMDDTQSLRIVGVVRNDQGAPILPAGTQGDGTIELPYQSPRYVELTVTGVTAADIGRRVYALDDQSGTLNSSGTTFGNLIGTVARLVRNASGAVVSNMAQVELALNQPNGEQLQIAANSGAVAIKSGTVVLTKAGVAAMTIADPTTGVHDGVTIKFISSTAQAHTVSNAAGSGFNAGGAAADVGTFGGAIGDGFQITAYGGKWLVNYLRNVTLA